jgi:hypothetical protein
MFVVFMGARANSLAALTHIIKGAHALIISQCPVRIPPLRFVPDLVDNDSSSGPNTAYGVKAMSEALCSTPTRARLAICSDLDSFEQLCTLSHASSPCEHVIAAFASHLAVTHMSMYLPCCHPSDSHPDPPTLAHGYNKDRFAKWQLRGGLMLKTAMEYARHEPDRPSPIPWSTC